jgi:peptidoglycan/LPS O-acetylase OafA/YrhL
MPLAGGGTKAGRFGELDSLRGLAAVLVMLYHYSFFLRDRSPGFPLIGLGPASVAGFFMISGFVISLTAEKHTLRGFVRNRAIRIFPTFWLCLALTLGLVPLLGGAGNYSAKQIGLNATMLPSFFFARSIDDVYWTLEVELSFYCVIAVLIAGGWLKWTERLAAAGLIVFLAVNLTIGGVWNPDWSAWRKLALLPFMLSGYYTQAPLLLAGMLFYRVRQSGFTWTRAALLLLCAGGPFLSYEPAVGCEILVIFALFTRLALADIRILQHSALRFLGYISYPLYLVHHNIGQALLGDLVGVLPAFWAMLGTVIAILGLAAAIHLFFEKPVTRWLRSLGARQPAAPPPPAGEFSGPEPRPLGVDLNF